MSHYIPVFFFPVKEAEIPQQLSGWEDALSLIGKRFENRRKSGLRESVSRNWWHQYTLDLICKGLQIDGLEFIRSEIVCLHVNELKAALKALDTVLNKVADDIPNLGPFEDTDIEGLRIPKHKKAVKRAKSSYKINVKTDWGFNATVGFYSFVKSLREAMLEAIAKKQCLLYVQIQS